MNIAFFDFDGTITKKDSWYDFMIFVSKKHKLIYLKTFLFLPIIVLYSIGFISEVRYTELYLTFCFKGWKMTYFDELGKNYAKTKLPNLVRHKALKQIINHKSNGDKTVVVTASLDSWIINWCQDNGMELISSNLEICNGLITGKLNGVYCQGIGKVKRIQEKFDLDNFETVYAYGDSSGDIAMLELADIAFLRWEKQE